MKNLAIVLLVAIFLVVNCQVGYADSPVKKLGRGLANTFFGWWEFPRQIMDETDKGGPVSGMTVGTCKGVAYTVGRTLAGLYETVTFFLPVPEEYEPLIKDPEYPFQEKPEFQF